MGRSDRARALAIAVVIASSLFPAPVAAHATSMGQAAAPVLVSPINGETITSAPVLRWSAGVNALEYGVTVWPAGNPAQPVCTAGGPATWVRCEDVPPGTYEWTVQSLDLGSHPAGISAVGTFKRATPTIAAPALLTPANGAVLDYPDDIGVIRWAPAAGAVYYEVQVSTSPTFAGATPDPAYGFAILSVDVPRENIGVKHYWRVRGVNAHKTWAGPWSATRSFTVTWSEVPSLTAPLEGASASNIVLQWAAVKGASRYDIQVTAIGDTDFSDAIQTWEEATWIAWGDIPAGDLRWRVRAQSDHGGSTAWSGARTIHRDAGAPAALQPDPLPPPDVVLTSPADGATFPSSAAEVTFAWTPVAGALKYEFDKRISGGSWTNLGLRVGAGPIRFQLDPGETFEWRIRAVGEGGVMGAWSDVRELTIEAPGPLTLLSPADGEDILASNQIASWQAVPGSLNYRVEIDDDPDFDGWQDYGQYRLPGTSDGLGAREAGRWYWRVRAGVIGTDALSEVRAVDIIDDMAPAGIVGFLVPSTMESSTPLNLSGRDPFGEVVEAQVSADGATWESFAMSSWGDLQVAWSLTSPAHGGGSPGQRHVHARFIDAAGNVSAQLSASIWYGMDPPLDETPPTGTIAVAGGAAYTRTRLPTVDIPASDIHDVTTIALSTDGVTWNERPYWPTQQVTVSSANGTKTVRVKWKDSKGNWSAVKSDTIVLDTVVPTATAPKHAFKTGSVSGGATPMKFTWSGADSRSGVARYEAALSTDGGSYSTLSAALTSATLTRSLAAGHTYRLRVRTIDKAGNVGAWAMGPTFNVTAYQESASKLVFTGSWTRPANTSYWGDFLRTARTAGAKASITFTGRGFAWVGCVGPSRGSAKIYVNGNLVKTVSTHATTASCQRVLTTLSWATAASRKVSIVVSGTSGHPRIDVDAIVVN